MDVRTFLNENLHYVMIGFILLIILITVTVVLYFKYAKKPDSPDNTNSSDNTTSNIINKYDTVNKMTEWNKSSEYDNCINDKKCLDARMLDRHNIVCDKGALRAFNLEFNDSGNMRYKYECLDKKDLEDIQEKDTTYSDNTLDGLVQKTNMVCDQNSLLTNIKMNYSADKKARNYKYGCAKSKSQLKCENYNTEPVNIVKIDNTNYFKDFSEFKIKCPENTAMSEIKFEKTDDKYKYVYKCCH